MTLFKLDILLHVKYNKSVFPEPLVIPGHENNL